jgi:hypothetical protein
MLRKKIFILLIAGLVFLPLPLRANTIRDSTGIDNGYVYLQYSFQHDMQPFEAGISIARTFWRIRVEHDFMMGGVNLVKQGRYARYSFKFPVSLLTLGLTSGLERIFLGKKQGDNLPSSAFYYILTIPNCIWNLRIVDHLQINAGIQTDYLLYRDHGLDRGLLITPTAGIGWYWGRNPVLGSLNVWCGNARLWNFDGLDRKYGWGINLALILSGAFSD